MDPNSETIYHVNFIKTFNFNFSKLSTGNRLNSLKPTGYFKNTYEFINLWALKFSLLKHLHIFQCMGKIFDVEFQSCPLKFHIKYLTHTLKDEIFIQCWKFVSSQIYALIHVFEMPPTPHPRWYIYGSLNWVNICSDNDLLPVWHQAIISTNADLL